MEQIILFAFVAIVYFIPSIAASGKKGSDGIIALNVLLGWTGIGWIGALIWALVAENRPIKRSIPIVVKLCPYCGVTTRTTVENRCVDCHGLKD